MASSAQHELTFRASELPAPLLGPATAAGGEQQRHRGEDGDGGSKGERGYNPSDRNR
jgi:hypothetical protein